MAKKPKAERARAGKPEHSPGAASRPRPKSFAGAGSGGPAAQTLFHPFESGLVEAPPRGARVLFLNAMPGLRRTGALAAGRDLSIAAVQDFRPLFLALAREGLNPVPRAEGEGFEATLIALGRHRGLNESWLAQALRRTAPGGLILAAGANADGAASLRKRLAGLVELGGHVAKSHGVAFWLACPADAREAAEALEAANPARLPEGGFRSGPGMFSHEAADAGSALLADSLPDDIGGSVADFGAGWGFLSVAVARRARKLVRLDLYEAGFAACEAARENLAALAPQAPARVFWHDLLSEKVETRYDTIVMNPPFHRGRAAEPGIGEAMIAAAARALKSGGRLLMVANRQLPYERVLAAAFRSHGESGGDGRFKLLWARA